MKQTTRLKDFGHRKILIIEDDQDILDNYRAFFELEEYGITCTSNGQEALTYLATLSDADLPDLILLDFMMPIMDGRKFCEERKKVSRLMNIPVVLITASGLETQLSQELDVDASLDKVSGFRDLERIIFNFIHRRGNSKHSFIT